MVKVHAFSGSVMDSNQLVLGEGPSYDPKSGRIYWFNILQKELHELDPITHEKSVHHLPVMASVFARIDDERQLLATESGLFIRKVSDGSLSLHCDFEPERIQNRSNDGRMHPSGALWIGTMGKSAETDSGAIYHIAKGVVTTIVERISIPNAICFSPDGSIGYFVDSSKNQLMRIALDASTGLPTSTPEIFIDRSDADGGMDGAVCDLNGTIWNAFWGGGCIDHYDTKGQLVEKYLVPAKQPSCPAFYGANADRLFITSAFEGIEQNIVESNPCYGQSFDLGVSVKGQLSSEYKL